MEERKKKLCVIQNVRRSSTALRTVIGGQILTCPNRLKLNPDKTEVLWTG